jgi:acylphosphatase
MIARKIIYTGSLDAAAAELIYDVVRDVEITGIVRFAAEGKVELELEGDPSQIQLAQHRVERKVKGHIKGKTVVPQGYRNLVGLDFLR